MPSSVPVVLDAIRALIAAACPGLPIWEGAPLSDSPDMAIIGGFNEDAAAGSYNPSGYGTGKGDEDYDVPVILIATSGDVDQVATRNRAYGYFDAILAAYQADRNFAGVIVARPTFPAYRPTDLAALDNGDPWMAQITFGFHVSTTV